ncbi:MAG: GNAT family N-acetyltransferase [Candidatus Kariarchaeaceae archaeon]|jgi:GNAT superfamily N-acetyltransferase
MGIVSRGYTKDDFDEIMRFLREVYDRTQSYQNWFPNQFEDTSIEDIEKDIRIWENIQENTSQIVAVTHPESDRRIDYFIQIDPDYSYLEKEIIMWIQEHWKTKMADVKESWSIKILTIEGNIEREAALSELKFKNTGRYSYHRIRPHNDQIPPTELPEGYKIRNVEGWDDYERLAENIRLIFGHGEWFTADTLQWIKSKSFYKQELDLLVIAPDESIACFGTFRMDPISRITELEPLATHPEHRKLGLAKALICEGLRRSEKFNPPFFYIGGAADTPAANRLYDVVGFSQKLSQDCWIKEF